MSPQTDVAYASLTQCNTHSSPLTYFTQFRSLGFLLDGRVASCPDHAYVLKSLLISTDWSFVCGCILVPTG